MAAILTVSQIRNALYLKQAGDRTSGQGRTSTAALGTLFHTVLAGILTDQSPCSLQVVLQDHDPDIEEWKSALKVRVYDQLVGPLLTQQYAAMNGQGRQILDLWTAVQQACDFLVEMWWAITAGGTKVEYQAQWFDSEHPISREFHQPGWSTPVAVVGQLDAVLRVPDQGHCCLLEWKLGQTSPELDLAQACLYQMLLQGELGAQHHVALAVVGFYPERHEQLFQGPQLDAVRQELLTLVGELAGVTSGPRMPESTPPIAQRTPRVPTEVPSPPIPRPPVTVVVAAPSLPLRLTTEQQFWLRSTFERLIQALKIAKAPCRAAREPVLGPAFGRFFVFPERGITPKKVISQADSLHLHLQLPFPPGMQVIDGTIAIDLPRPDRQSIPFSDVIAHLPPHDPLHGGSCIPVGQDLSGRWEWCDLASDTSPHVLVVGTPGSGKSQWLRAALASLLKTNTPETLELVLIDPKQNAFQFAKESPQLSRPIIVPGVEDIDVFEILSTVIDRMQARNRVLAENGAQDLKNLARILRAPQRRVVVICDEYADLLAGCHTAADRKELEKLIQRIAQVGRAAGFHLILATQQPRKEILNTNIRSLMSAKVTLRVTSALESNVAIGDPGAERLLGKGDLYYKCIGPMKRFQGAWLPSEEESLVTNQLSVLNQEA